MKFELVILPELSGPAATIYSVIPEGSTQTLFKQFVEHYGIEFREELKSILLTLRAIGNKTGARYQFFKHDEGKPGDGVCALYDDPKRKLRVYCIRFGNDLLILGAGGEKVTRTWQQDSILSAAAEQMIAVSKQLMRRIEEERPNYYRGGKHFEGDLTFFDDDEDE